MVGTEQTECGVVWCGCGQDEQQARPSAVPNRNGWIWAMGWGGGRAVVRWSLGVVRLTHSSVVGLRAVTGRQSRLESIHPPTPAPTPAAARQAKQGIDHRWARHARDTRHYASL